MKIPALREAKLTRFLVPLAAIFFHPLPSSTITCFSPTTPTPKLNSLLRTTMSSTTASLLPTSLADTRVELFFKSPTDLKDRVRFLKESYGITSFNLVNKHKSDDLTQWIQCIREETMMMTMTAAEGEDSTTANDKEGVDICAHYSLKYQKIPRKPIQDQQEKLQTFLQETDATEVLLISGSGNNKSAQWSTVEALQAVRTLYQQKNEKGGSSELPKLAVAYNPYFPSLDDQFQENRRLEQKLATGCVSKVYLQFGSSLDRLKDGLEFCQQSITKYTADTSTTTTTAASDKCTIAGSLFLPTKQLIAQQKFRPWNGVFLTPEFLSSPESASAILVEMMKMYQKYNVEFLWEAPGIKREKDIMLVEQLLRQVQQSSTWIDMVGSKIESGSGKVELLDHSPPQTKRLKLDDDTHTGTTSSSTTMSTTLDLSNIEKKSAEPCLLLFGSHDVRLRDNRAVEGAMMHHHHVLPVFLWTTQDAKGPWGVRGAAQVVLKDALRNLESSLQSFKFPLVCCNCKSPDGVVELMRLVQLYGAKTVYWNKECTPEARDRNTARCKALSKVGVTVHETQSSLLYDPDRIELSSGFHGGHWGTLMPFLKNCKKRFGDPPRPTPYHETFRLLEETKAPSDWKTRVDKEALGWISSVNDLDMAIISGRQRWDEPIRKRFPMSTQAAYEAMESFVKGGLPKYEKERSRADLPGATSELSPHLRFGTISPNELYWRIEDSGLGYDKLKTFSRRLFWRDLAYYQLACFPEMRKVSIRRHYEQTKWVDTDEERRRFEAWRRGQTGFPIVDAGMRELYATGWMTQSVRMVVASFLVEYLRVNWTKGCEWFHYTLADADSAINAMMWQNAGKSGIDQWNFVLSPVTASQDPTGAYTRKWVPELAQLPTSDLVHRPWEAPPDVLEQAKVVLGETYPCRIVEDLHAERQMSVESTLTMRRASQDANSDRGYDLILLPDGKQTVVFTKKEYRIDANGEVIREGSETKHTTTSRGRSKKASRKKTVVMAKAAARR